MMTREPPVPMSVVAVNGGIFRKLVPDHNTSAYTKTAGHSPVRRTTKSRPTLKKTPLEWSIANRRRCESPLWLWFKLMLARLLSPASLSRNDCSPCVDVVSGCGCRSGDRSPFKCPVGDELVIVFYATHTEYVRVLCGAHSMEPEHRYAAAAAEPD